MNRWLKLPGFSAPLYVRLSEIAAIGMFGKERDRCAIWLAGQENEFTVLCPLEELVRQIEQAEAEVPNG